MKQLFTLEWYFPAFVVEVYKRMYLKSEEPWLTPDEMYQEIQKNDAALFSSIKEFFALYENWYNHFDCSEAKAKAIGKRKEIANYINQKY